MAQPRQAILLGHACHTPAWPVPSTLSASIQMTYLQTVREVSHGLSWVYSCSATRTPRGILLSEALRKHASDYIRPSKAFWVPALGPSLSRCILLSIPRGPYSLPNQNHSPSPHLDRGVSAPSILPFCISTC